MYEREVESLSQLSKKNVKGVVQFLAAQRISPGEREKEKGLILTDFYQTNLFEELKNNRYKPSEIISILANMTKTLK